MEYEIIYDAARDIFGWQFIVGWMALVGFFLTMIYNTGRISRFVFWLLRINENDTGWGRTIIFLGALILGAVSVAIIRENLELRSISKNNDCTEIAGVVMDFKGGAIVDKNPQIRLRKESFTLDDLGFEYDTHFMVSGFNKIAADGGPIYEGASVRLCYIEQIENRKKERKIIRVERALDQSND